MKTKVAFMGSPEFAVPTLQSLIDSYDVVGVVTQPDRPAGRGRRITEPAVKKAAVAHGIPVMQPRQMRAPEALAHLRDWAPDVIVVAAYGQILLPAVLDLPRHGCVNIHPSLLPRWRGAAPIAAAIRHGDSTTGTTIMIMDPGMDTGPLLSQQEVPILPEDTTESLNSRLAVLSADLLIETLPGYLSGRIQPQAQNDDLATFAPRLKKADGQLDFQKTAEALARQVRAFHPWPGTFTELGGEIFKIHRAHVLHDLEGLSTPGTPGERTHTEDLPAIWTGKGLLVLDEVQPAGKKAMPGAVFLRGARNW